MSDGVTALLVFGFIVVVMTFGAFLGDTSRQKDGERKCLIHHEVTLNGTTFHCEVKEEQ